MHETSIVNSIIRTLEQEFEAEKLNKMKSIHLKVGILSNIEPRLLYNAYDASHMMNPKYQNVKFVTILPMYRNIDLYAIIVKSPARM
jgi:hydrogenase nickel incorporation protein HypA/HybF